MTTAQPPGLLRRLAAIGYDALIVAALLIGATAAMLPFSKGESIAAGTLWYQLVLGAIVLLYFSASWWRSGQTIGMLAWRLRLQTADGARASFAQCLIRAMAAVISGLAVGLGFLWVLIDRRARGWHDLLSRTQLVYDRPVSEYAPARKP